MRPRALMPGETMDLLPTESEPVIGVSDEQITARYVRGDVRIVTEQSRTQLPELPVMLESGRYQLQPDYQRRRRWSTGKQSRLIESFLINVPIPPIFLYEYDYARYEVMDGQQRLRTLLAFYKDELVLTEMEYWPELEGRTYSTLPAALRQGIDRRFLSSIVLLYETASNEYQAEQLKQLVFERINSGGIRLSPQESRNAASFGVLNETLPRLARNPAFCRAWGIPEPDHKEISEGIVRDEVRDDNRYQSMEDVETVLRFFAHRQRTSVGPLRSMKIFLDSYWSKANASFTQELVDQLSTLFIETIELVYDVLAERAFHLRRSRPAGRIWVPRPTLIAYDAVMAAFSRHLDNADALRSKREEVRIKLSDLYDENAIDFDGRKTDPQDVARRDELLTNMLEEIVSPR